MEDPSTHKNTTPINEQDVRAFYNWLDHKSNEYTEVRIIPWPSSGSVIQRWVQSQEDFVEICREWNGKRQIYAGINPRKWKGGSSDAISRVTGIPFDVDSDHEPDVACTDEELEKAQKRCIQLKSLLLTRGYKNPYLDMSGNGYRVALKVDIPITKDLPKKLESFFHEINNALPFTMDSIFDLPRIIKVPGTMSIKGIPTEEHPHRLSHILTLGNDKPDKALKKHIESLGLYSPPIDSNSAKKIYKLIKCFQRFIEEGGKLSDVQSEDHLLRLALVIEAHFKGYNKDQIYKLFENADDFSLQTTKKQVDWQLGKIAVEGLKPWKCTTIFKHHGCWFGKKCFQYSVIEEQFQIPNTEYSIVSARRGRGFVILDNDDEPVSKIKDTKKYKKAMAEKLNISVEAFEKAILDAEFQPSLLQEKDTRNPGAVIFDLVCDMSEEVFMDQLDETFITYKEKVDISDIYDRCDRCDRRFSIVYLSPLDVFFDIAEKKLSPLQSKHRESPVTPVTQKPYIIELYRTIRIKSRKFKRLAASLYYMEEEKAPSGEAIKAAVLLLESDAKNKRPMYNRIAPDGDDGVWWDMSDKYGRAIHITKEGWNIVINPPQIFKRYPHQLPLVEPAEVGSLAPLLDYVILEDPLDKLLNVVTPITYLIPEVPHVIEFLGGPQGVTKSTAHRFRRMVVDPSSIPLLLMPKDDLNQMIQHGDHHYLLMYDNVSSIDDEQSDLLCRMCTGLGFQKRMLYSDDDTVIRQYLRCININGITLSGEKGDLLNRAIILTAAMLEDKDRRTEREMKKKMSEDAPKVVRGFLDVLVRAMRLYDGVKPKRNNRMADFTRWGCAITQAMGIDKKYFEDAYANNITTQHEEAVKSNPVAEWLIQWFDYRNFESGYEGTASTILNEILVYAKNVLDRNLSQTVDGWPRGTNPFAKKLKRAMPDLNAIGYRVKYTHGRSARKYRIEKIVKKDEANKTKTGQRALLDKKVDRLTSDYLKEKLLVIDTLEKEGED